MKMKSIALAASMLVVSSSINAASILVSQGTVSSNYGYGSTGWSNMTNAMNAAVAGGSIDVTANFSNLSQLLSYDALWLDTRAAGSSLSTTEINNITSFIATGRRVVLNGENTAWNSWNQSVLATVGGSAVTNTYSNGVYNSVISNSLTNSVNDVYFPAAGIAIGGTALFAVNSITLWGASDNVVSMLDVNLCSNDYWSYNDNAQFCGNLATWAASSAVPVPAAVWLFGSGLVGLVGLARRKTS